MPTILKFCGAAGMVTGSCYWVQTDQCQFLVDCGLFQGSKTVKQLNYGAFPFDPSKIDFVLLTHAHADHAALLPKLFKHGFTGTIYATRGTKDLLSFMLPDSGHIQEVEVEQLNRRNVRRGRAKVEPIYTQQDGERCLEQVQTVDYENWCNLGKTARARFWNAGHILGSASIEVELPATDGCPQPLRLLFSGDIGPDCKLFHPDPDAPSNFDYVFCEATYGGRDREEVSPLQRRQILATEVNQALDQNGILIIPTFAIERTQELLLDLAHLLNDGAIPPAPVFLDSPLAIRVTSVFADHADDLEDVDGVPNPFQHPSFHFTETVDESKAIERYRSGAIILAGSGMCDAGRVRHHLRHHLWRRQATVLLVGYQAPATLGDLLLKGVKTVRIQGEPIEVRARIRQIDIYSAHADGTDLVEWVLEREPVSRRIFLTHGNEESLAALKHTLIEKGLDAKRITIPQLDDEYDLLHGRRGLQRQGTVRRVDPAAVSRPDWHNELAQLTLDIRKQLEGTADNRGRGVILRRLRRALKEN